MRPRSVQWRLDGRKSAPRGIFRRMLRLLVGAGVLGFVLYTLAGFYGVPWLVDRWLGQYRTAALDRTASREDVRFNPFTLSGEIVGIELRDRASGMAFSAERIAVDFTANSLTSLRPAARSIDIERPRLQVASVMDLPALASLARDNMLYRAQIERLKLSGGTLVLPSRTGSAIQWSDAELTLSAFDGMAGNTGEFDLIASSTSGTGLAVDGSLSNGLNAMRGRLQIDALDLAALAPQMLALDVVTTRPGSSVADAGLSGQANLSAAFSAVSMLSRPAIEITDATLQLSGVSLSPVPDLSMAITNAAGRAYFELTARDGSFDLRGRVETDDAQLTIRDERVVPPQTFAYDDAALVANSNDEGLSLILGGLLRNAGETVLTARLPRGPGAGSVSIEASDLPVATLSAYVSGPFALRLAAGSAGLDLQYSLGGSRADAAMQLAVRNLELAPPSPDSQLEGAELELAAALLEDADGVINLDLRFASDTGNLREAATDALSARVAAVTATPFDTLATNNAGPGRPADAIAFQPGDAALGDWAIPAVQSLADALQARPRLRLRVFGSFDETADRVALARQQIELHVALATAGATAQARPAPVNFGSSRAQDVLDEFAGERLSADRVATLARTYMCQGALADVCVRVYYEQIFNALVANEDIRPSALSRLGRFRAQTVIDALRQRGIEDDRLEVVTDNRLGETSFGIGLAVELTAGQSTESSR